MSEHYIAPDVSLLKDSGLTDNTFKADVQKVIKL